jgi:ATP-binding cassette subfamily F protein 3
MMAAVTGTSTADTTSAGKGFASNTTTAAGSTAATAQSVSENKLDWKAQKEEQARLRKKENDLKKCEEKIAELENRLQEIDEEMSDPEIGTQVFKLQDLAKEQSLLNEQLEELYAQWEILAE